MRKKSVKNRFYATPLNFKDSLLYKQITNLIKYFLLWLLYFIIVKALFLISNFDLTNQLSAFEIWGIFKKGLIMDISTACYILIFPSLLLIFRFILSSRIINRVILFYTIIIIIVVTTLQAVELSLYPHWGVRLSASFLEYLSDPASLKATISSNGIIRAVLLIIPLAGLFIFLNRKIFPAGIASEGKVVPATVISHLVLTLALIIPIRGGFDTSPLNHASVAFSSKLYVNQSATNYLWNFIKSVLKRDLLSNPCIYFPKDESDTLFSEFMKPDPFAVQPQLINSTLNTDPNVILIILESFTGKAVESLGGLKGITPNLDQLMSNNVSFTNFYASGNRSDRGISALLAGYPALLNTSVTLHSEKMNTLTLLPQYFNRHGYHTSFYYGGDINFYNLRTLVLQAEYKSITTKENFPSELGKMTKWGVPDEYLFERAVNDLSQIEQPFMQTIYTLSSHHPFDVPFSKISGSSQEAKFLNSIAYTDSCLGLFINQLEKLPFWENTLLIVTADHGALDPGPTAISDPETYHIPLIWAGGVIHSSKEFNIITQQIDLGTTIINQLGWESDESPFSQNFFTKRPYAFYMFSEGWGYITSDGTSVYSRSDNNFSKTEIKDQNRVNQAKAYMQSLHNDFINR